MCYQSERESKGTQPPHMLLPESSQSDVAEHRDQAFICTVSRPPGAESAESTESAESAQAHLASLGKSLHFPVCISLHVK